MNKPKIAVVVSHPIQHFCPMYASWATIPEFDLKVFFASSTGVKKYYDPNFKKEISWKRLYLDKFNHEFLNNGEVLPSNKKLDAPDLNEKLKEYNPDVVIVYGYSQKLQRRAKRWAITNNKKVLMISDSELRHHRPWYVKLLKNFIIPYRIKGFDGFLTVGDANEEYYMHFSVQREKLFRSPFPIDIYLYEQAFDKKVELRKNIREKYNIKDDDLVLAVVGKLVKWKRQIDIINALKILDSELNNIVLFIIGSGEEENSLKEAAQLLKNNKVKFTGFVAPEDLPSYYAATDIYIHPAEKEPHSLAISEAIYMGCPVIISDRCGSYGPTDDVRENLNGLIFSNADINDLANKIKKLSINKNLRINFEINSRKFAGDAQNIAHDSGIKESLELISYKQNF